jgi:adenylate kinase
MNVVLMGLPGTGKGTQAEKIVNKYNIPHISTGDMLRAEIKEETLLGKKAKENINSGNLVPDEVIVEMVRNRLLENDCKDGFLLDGFPRTEQQAEKLDQILTEMNREINDVILIDVDQEILIERLSGRRICQNCGKTYHLSFNPPELKGQCNTCMGELAQRKDDDENTVKNRIVVNNSQQEKLKIYYHKKEKLSTVNGSLPIESVFNSINQILKTKINV